MLELIKVRFLYRSVAGGKSVIVYKFREDADSDYEAMLELLKEDHIYYRSRVVNGKNGYFRYRIRFPKTKGQIELVVEPNKLYGKCYDDILYTYCDEL